MKNYNLSQNKFSLNQQLVKILILVLIPLSMACRKGSHPHPDPEPQKNYTIFFGSQNGLFYALNGQDGKLIWKFQDTGGDFTYGYPVYDNGVIYTTNISSGLYALDAVTGAVKWKFAATGEILSGPAVDNGIVFFGSRDHYMYAVNAATGTLKWKFRTPFNLDSSPTVSKGIVFIGSSAGILFAFDTATGVERWACATGSEMIQAKPEVSNGVVYIGNRNGFVSAVNMYNGQLTWTFNAHDNISLEDSRIIINNGVLYFGSQFDPDDPTKAGSLYAIKELDGTLIWKGLVGKGGFKQGPYLSKGILYASNGVNRLYAVNATTGTQIWDANTPVSNSTPTAAFGKIFMGSADNGDHIGHFTAFNDASGAIIWQYPLPNTILTSKAIVLGEDGTVY